jgi:hypothetical protein
MKHITFEETKKRQRNQRNRGNLSNDQRIQIQLEERDRRIIQEDERLCEERRQRVILLQQKRQEQVQQQQRQQDEQRRLREQLVHERQQRFFQRQQEKLFKMYETKKTEAEQRADKRGLPKHIVEIVLSHTDEKSCVICYDDLSMQNAFITKCGHMMCKGCEKKMYDKKNKNCPTCRTEF